jgi:hypothetical protein
MAIPIIGWAAVMVISIAAGFSIYQLRLSISDVTEVFTDESSAFNSPFIQVGLLGAVVLILAQWKK